MRKIVGKGILMLVGALILSGGVFIGQKTAKSNTVAFNASGVSSEDVLKSKSDIIDKVVHIDENANKFIASRKASELSNLDIAKLQEVSKKGLVIIVVPQEDVYQSIDPTRAEENKKNGVVTDSVYIPKDNKLVVSSNAPTGVLTQQVASIIEK